MLGLRTESKDLGVTPAMEAGISDHVWNAEEIARLAEQVSRGLPNFSG